MLKVRSFFVSTNPENLWPVLDTANLTNKKEIAYTKVVAQLRLVGAKRERIICGEWKYDYCSENL